MAGRGSETVTPVTTVRRGSLKSVEPGPGNPDGYAEAGNVLSDRAGGGTDEGRAMLPIVHDVAPGASLALASAAMGQAAFAQGIADLTTVANADVVVDDLL